MQYSILMAIMSVVPAALILYAVGNRSKDVSACAQLGSVQDRHVSQQARQHTTAKELKRWDKLCFTLGVVNVGLTTYVLGVAPAQFYLWHSPKSVLLVLLRWLKFRQQKRHYLLYDFCYWANLLALVFVWLLPRDPALFGTVFLCANGPLAWSVLAFDQSLVFHSPQHITSVFIHVSPMFLTFGLRWAPAEVVAAAGFVACGSGPGGCLGESAAGLLWRAVSRFYVWWIVGYYLWVFGVCEQRVRERGYQTLYDRVSQKGPLAKIIGARGVLGGASLVTKRLVYMCFHLLFGCFTMALACLLWFSFASHLLFVLAICASSAWNAANFYFEHFASEYEAHVRAKLEAEQRPGGADGGGSGEVSKAKKGH
jgi:hypothetical protein